MTMAQAAVAVIVASCAGAGVVAAIWPRQQPLPWLAWLGLGGISGPCVVGTALLLCGIADVPPRVSIPLIASCSIAAAVAGLRRRRQLPRPVHDQRPHVGVACVVLLATVWCGWIAWRTHLGWDGTVVWYHKARIVAAASGALPAAAVGDPTRTWTAPDYPLHVPLAMAWVRLWLTVEDERAIKVLPAAWSAALFCLLAAAVLERSGNDRHGPARAIFAVAVLASAPRLLVGEGSLTSGYADGPLAGLLAATVWIAWRSEWGRERAFQPLLAVLATALAWTKQEGVVSVLVLALACVLHGRHWSRSLFAMPALLLAASWQAWSVWHGAPSGMAYAWPGAIEAAARIGLIVRAYGAEALDTRTWGLLWPGLLAALGLTWTRDRRLPVLVLVGGLVAGGLAFTLSGWADVAEHLRVTVPRQYIQAAPLLALLAFAAGRSPAPPR